MIRKSISLIAMFTMALICSSTLNAQEDGASGVLESIMLTPDYKNLKTFEDNMREHNKKYHASEPYNAEVYNISTGPNAGSLIWMMGPTTYTHLDARPTGDGHDEHWRDKIMPYIKKIETVEFWKMDSKLSNLSMMDGDITKTPVIFVRYHEIEPGEIPGAFAFLEYLSKTIKAMEGENPWGVYVNEFRQGNLGRHIATVSFMKNWAEMDENDNDFKKVFGEANGEENWSLFQDLGRNSFSNSWDEVWNLNKYMSGK